MYTAPICNACKMVLDLPSASLSQAYYYASLPYCVIDAVFSIGVKYTGTQNVVKNYCTYYGLQEFNQMRDRDVDVHTISQLIHNIISVGVENSADVIFKNHQRTSSRNGILKAEAVFRFATILQKYGIETLSDMAENGIPSEAEREILEIPGQKSGLALRYFCMLAGDDTKAKPDRHVLRFLKEYTGHTFSVMEAQNELIDAAEELREEYPHITVRLLDYSIWNYMAHQKKSADNTTKRYYKLVRDRIPEIIEADGKTCTCEILSDEDYLCMVDAKLDEELAEYHKDQNIEELADLLEVIYAVTKARGYSLEQLEAVRAEKAAKRGAFEKKLLLKEVIEN